MTRFFLIFIFLFTINQTAFSQIISFEKMRTFTIPQLDSIGLSLGIPAGVFVADYEVDIYKVLYLTPYKHIDSLVQASGAVAIARNSPCPLPIVAYGHGTNSKVNHSASRMNAGQWEINCLFASKGFVAAMPDYLGLGFPDPKVKIHPYTHSFSQANTTINMMRAARILADSVNVDLNGQIFLYGYSQGGGSTVATVKEIQQKYSSEFQITASAPMSGAYDLKDAQVQMIASDSVYATPGYLPFIILAYQSIYGNLFNHPSDIFKAPYDSILPPMFYNGNTGIGNINNICEPVPKHMIHDSIVQAFLSDSLHPLRLDLLDNHLIEGWYPTSPMKLYYCDADEQVSYMNSENAYTYWTAQGAPHLEKQNMGNMSHGDCAPFSFLDGFNYFNIYKSPCNVGVMETGQENRIELFPNPANNVLNIRNSIAVTGTSVLSLFNYSGELVKSNIMEGTNMAIDISSFSQGLYFLKIESKSGVVVKKWVKGE